MNIIIKNMEMPEDCRVCPMQIYDSYSGETKCRAIDKILAEDYKTIPFDGRPKWCPLVELTPHGRLIDADKLMGKIKDVKYKGIMLWKMYTNFFLNNAGKSYVELGCVENLIENTPTVLEAEVEE